MKKTLTVNLGGTVYHIDEDAYKLLDTYLSNLRIHFRREEGAEEIVHDMELRISELFTDRLNGGKQVITIEDVEEIIAQVGKPKTLVMRPVVVRNLRKAQRPETLIHKQQKVLAGCFVIRIIKYWEAWPPVWLLTLVGIPHGCELSF